MSAGDAHDEDVLDLDGFVRLDPIASGGQCTVFEVIEPGTGRHVAMKMVKGDVEGYAEAKANLKHEFNVGRTLDHPNIIKFERGEFNRDVSYITMEYFRAANVKAQIKQELLQLHARARRLFEGICVALSHMHERGWVHRDLKPDNMLLNRAGEVRLLDFSLAVRTAGALAKLLGSGQRTIQGTRTYIAPETIRRQPATAATDTYSLGVTFFEVLTGKTPFQGSTPQDLLHKHMTAEPPPPSDLNKNVTPELDRLVIRMMAKKPIDRPKSMEELLGELRRIKLFKEEPDALIAEATKKSDDAASTLQKVDASKIDSRADAIRSEMLRNNPELRAQAEGEMRERMAKAAAKRAAAKAGAKEVSNASKASARGEGGPAKPGTEAPTAPAPVAPMMPPGAMPQMPPGYMPPYLPQMGAGAPPQYMPPGTPQFAPQFAPPGGMPYPGQVNPGPGYPGVPPVPPGAAPASGMIPGGGQPRPPAPSAPPQAPARPAAVPSPGAAPPAAARRPAAPPSAPRGAPQPPAAPAPAPAPARAPQPVAATPPAAPRPAAPPAAPAPPAQAARPAQAPTPARPPAPPAPARSPSTSAENARTAQRHASQDQQPAAENLDFMEELPDVL